MTLGKWNCKANRQQTISFKFPRSNPYKFWNNFFFFFFIRKWTLHYLIQMKTLQRDYTSKCVTSNKNEGKQDSHTTSPTILTTNLATTCASWLASLGLKRNIKFLPWLILLISSTKIPSGAKQQPVLLIRQMACKLSDSRHTPNRFLATTAFQPSIQNS